MYLFKICILKNNKVILNKFDMIEYRYNIDNKVFDDFCTFLNHELNKEYYILNNEVKEICFRIYDVICLYFSYEDLIPEIKCLLKITPENFVNVLYECIKKIAIDFNNTQNKKE